MLGLDPRMIKFGVVKLGDGTLKSIGEYAGRVVWNRMDEAMERRDELDGRPVVGGSR